MTDCPTVSVIVVSHGRPALLRRALTGIGQLFYRPFEVVVVADDDDARVAVEDLGRGVDERPEAERVVHLAGAHAFELRAAALVELEARPEAPPAASSHALEPLRGPPDPELDAPLREAGWSHQLIHGQKTYNGVAILSRRPLHDVVAGFIDGEPDPQARLLHATVDGVRIVNGYADAIVIRHYEQGAAHRAASVSAVPILNAGDGPGEHPTQALLDLYTIGHELEGCKGR